MTIIHRRIIYIFFMAVFAVVLPFIILYGNGYRYNLKKNNWQKTGIIFLESKPTEVAVYLNGIVVSEEIPIRLKDLLPNEHELKIVQTGYGTWQKKVAVYEGQTTFLQYVRLFKENTVPRLLTNGEFKKIVYLAKSNQLAAVRQDNNFDKIFIIDEEGGQEQEIYSSAKAISEIKIINNDSRLAVTAESGNVIFINLNEPSIVLDIKEIVGPRAIDNIKYDEASVNQVFFIEDKMLIRYNLISRAEETILNEEPLDYFVKDNKLFYLASNSLSKIGLIMIDLASGIKKEWRLNIEQNNDEAIAAVESGYVFIYNKDKKNLFIISEDGQKTENLAEVDFFHWSGENRELIFGNELELLTYRPEQANSEIILFTRSSEKISEAAWYAIATHILFVQGNKLRITENLPSNRYLVELARLSIIKNVLANKKGDKVFFIGQAGNQQGIYEIGIQ